MMTGFFVGVNTSKNLHFKWLTWTPIIMGWGKKGLCVLKEGKGGKGEEEESISTPRPLPPRPIFPHHNVDNPNSILKEG